MAPHLVSTDCFQVFLSAVWSYIYIYISKICWKFSVWHTEKDTSYLQSSVTQFNDVNLSTKTYLASCSGSSMSTVQFHSHKPWRAMSLYRFLNWIIEVFFCDFVLLIVLVLMKTSASFSILCLLKCQKMKLPILVLFVRVTVIA